MAGTTVDDGLNGIVKDVEGIRRAATGIKGSVDLMITNLGALPTKYAIARTEIEAYTEPYTDLEQTRVSKLAEYTPDFQALRDALITIQTALNAVTEF